MSFTIPHNKILIVGNSPKSQIEESFEDFYTVALGEGFFHLLNKRIDCWVVREPTYKTRIKDCDGITIILDPQKQYIDPKIMTINEGSNLTLGGQAIMFFKKNFDKPVYITGITTDLGSFDMQRGSFWNENYKRHNHPHNLINETMWLKSLLYERQIIEL